MQIKNCVKHNSLQPIAVFLLVLAAYFPQFYGFVGTDAGVYYETARRLAGDGRLELWQNYWDHKPPLIYLFLAPYTYLDQWLGDTYGLKIGAISAYGALSFLLYKVLSTQASSTQDRNLAALVASLFAAIVMGWMDFVANGLLMVSATTLAFAGLAMTIKCSNKKMAFFAGVLIGISPFFCPTALTALPFFFLILLMKKKKASNWSEALSAISGFSIAAGISFFLLTTFAGDSLIERADSKLKCNT